MTLFNASGLSVVGGAAVGTFGSWDNVSSAVRVAVFVFNSKFAREGGDVRFLLTEGQCCAATLCRSNM